MSQSVLLSGRKITIEFAVRAGGDMPAKEFYDSLDARDKRKLNPPMVRLAEDGRVENEEHFGKLQDDIWEFKAFQVRMPGFFLKGGRFILTHGFKKKKDRTPKSEIVRAETIRSEHIARESAQQRKK